MKLKSIKNLLPENPYLKTSYGYGAFKIALDAIGEKELDVSVCSNCGGSSWYAQQVSDTEQEQRMCEDCVNGVIIKLKEPNGK